MKGLQVFNDRAAGVDVGSESLHTSIAGGAPKVFGTMTADLYALRDHFIAHEVQTVAMEATGIYWLCVFEVLEAAGLEVVMVNGRHVQNVPGRKTDMAVARAWAVARGVCASRRHSTLARLYAASCRPHQHGRLACATHAKSAGSDEYQDSRSD